MRLKFAFMMHTAVNDFQSFSFRTFLSELFFRVQWSVFEISQIYFEICFMMFYTPVPKLRGTSDASNIEAIRSMGWHRREAGLTSCARLPAPGLSRHTAEAHGTKARQGTHCLRKERWGGGSIGDAPEMCAPESEKRWDHDSRCLRNCGSDLGWEGSGQESAVFGGRTARKSRFLFQWRSIPNGWESLFY